MLLLVGQRLAVYCATKATKIGTFITINRNRNHIAKAEAQTTSKLNENYSTELFFTFARSKKFLSANFFSSFGQ